MGREHAPLESIEAGDAMSEQHPPSTPDELHQLLTVDELAALLKVSKSWVAKE